jgi:DNA-binding transcriptional MerR regulator
MFSIGEFSKLTQMTVKTLRFYHEAGLLIPSYVDPETGYRYYEESHVATARAITYLRSLEFSISDIKELMSHEADEDILNALERQQLAIKERIRQLRKAAL